jgi:uncharacterized protein YjbI with pentapeptide repeats
MPKRLALAVLGLLLVTATWAQEAQKPEGSPVDCPHPEDWKPTDENLLNWLQKNKNENLCNIDLSGAKLANADLSGAKLALADLSGANLALANLSGANLIGASLSEANLTLADLSSANLTAADLTGARLHSANLNNADLEGAKLNSANLNAAELTGAKLFGAELNNASLIYAKLNGARLSPIPRLGVGEINAKLTGANLSGANLSEAYLTAADLTGADLNGANLTGAKLNRANLTSAILNYTSVAGAGLANTILTKASYAPASAPPNSDVAGIQGLSTVTFPGGGETGLVQLRDLLQKAGLRDLERQATFAIERGKTKHSLDDWKQNPAGAVEGVFRYVAFDLTTRYGMRPSRALLFIAALWLLLIPIYAWPIWQIKRPPTRPAIYRIWPKDRVGVQEHKPTLDTPERLNRRGLAAVGWSAYFSLLSAFQVGYREFSIGSWLTRAQPHNFALEATGWVRTVSGIQSLLSVFLLAMWLLTYFGRPFQ